MIDRAHTADHVRRKIEALGTSMSLPTVAKALGVLEGEHRSNRRGGNDDLLDIRPYEPGDEARAIDWKISARSGRAMVVQRERLASGRVYLLMDAGREMTASCPSGETAYAVAANALCMFAALSLRRSDDVSLVLGDAASITRVPFHGGLAQFERTLDGALDRAWDHARNLDALLDYAVHLRDRDALVVIASCEQALTRVHLPLIRRIARTHPLVVIDVGTVNPFAAQPLDGVPRAHVVDGTSGRRVPALLRNAALAQETERHRAFEVTSLTQELARCGARLMHASSSARMFAGFVRLVSLSRFGAPGAPTMLRTPARQGRERA
ncbi:hypothetical protein PG2083B_0743 [Bifidobacterium pseudolongum subsp. globosum]|uniref:DUF58 domain-containing protein n=1 Tax=Bifidobacterium pseudolongum TaxID=1694 RepID=UPI001021102D|nr:DUF58 domain-containing protein [Bifidobacterium pseudolongum]RYQ18031.1 hypothetical protein PG2083B_0743 [Bifidobacterium pseudolongum subsp. globosum]